MEVKIKVGKKEYSDIYSIDLRHGQIVYTDERSRVQCEFIDEIEVFIKVGKDWIKV